MRLRAIGLGALALITIAVSTAAAQESRRELPPWSAPSLYADNGAAAAPTGRDAASLRWPADSLERVGDYRWEGAAVGALLVGALGVALGASGDRSCPTEAGVQCDESRLGDAVLLGGLGIAGGGLLGFVVGLLSPEYEAVSVQVR